MSDVYSAKCGEPLLRYASFALRITVILLSAAVSLSLSPVYLPDDILDAIAAALARREDELRDEHAVHGLDSWPEVKFHALLAGALGESEIGGREVGVLREQPYPHEWTRKRRGGKLVGEDDAISPPIAISEYTETDLAAADPVTGELPDPRDRMRCDIVLTPAPGLKLGDPLAIVQSARARKQQAAGTLFAAIEATAPTPPPAADTCPPEDAFWLELKLVGQFTYSAGIAGPNVSYAAELTRGPAADARKLSSDGRIAHAAVLIMLFTHDLETAEHDLAQAMHRCLDRNLPIGSPIRRSVPIVDRIGNQWLTVCLVPVRTGS